LNEITQETVEAINSSIQAGEVIERYTGQRPINNAYLCPFHKDKRPSLTAKGKMWQCWACGAKGDTIGFAMQFFSIRFQDAVIRISSDFGVSIPSLRGKQEPEDEEALWNRIERECKRKNREQLREALDQKIKDLNEVHRTRMRSGAPDEELAEIAEELDWLIAELDSI